MKAHKAQKDILYISISSFALVAVWIASNLYHAYVTSTIEPDLQMQIEPIEPRFNTEIIQKLKNRQPVVPVYELTSATAGAGISPTTQVVTEPSASGSGDLTVQTGSIPTP